MGEDNESNATVYVCPVINFWSDFEAKLLSRSIPLTVEAAGVGFLAAYDSLEAYRKDYPDIKPLRMMATSKAKTA